MRTPMILTLTSLLAAGCGSMPPEQYDDKRLEAELYRADFLEFRHECWKQNKRVFIEARHRHPRNGIPEQGDRYYCI